MHFKFLSEVGHHYGTATAKAAYEAALRHFQNQGGVVKDDGTLDWGASDQLKLATQYFKRQGVVCNPVAYPALLQSGAGR